ncbi:TAXI family TRAP transporter solute-binding subunit [Testudinibacter sp. TR-2022]|uniref:TAXI family TRAP transporter solute-binding subunit n=1 Tax=Testudinibacter sp. TR-2022 TaxID=2585029 RepID=UPI00111880F4|nr:TAXI family TRAP transporter solute-binding subunit [Testudinibacter sp. TR-2022]TNH05730.1 TAXI family TRAP transporter solute-binding subunit [Pasteurellaceae bacterium Phil31]TNH10211.1 TAXI family TRAP transporter solute-binding subunit [Testudinibacter sp. TR-2022]TNH11824.1 TAXI family TRAP transporter solute-binding subunit [Testudinibacter sp. TR-2022]TNH12458.1 TAXI family TRAP transporter solute-binding subunit [Testudinibacter sp. TR-2022]TNH19365.1 TAXI family TRAP transporter s
MKKMKASFMLVATAALGLLLSACGEKPASSATETNGVQSKFITIATGGASGPYNIIATTLAEVYSKDLNTNSKTQTTGASVENINLLNQKKVEMAFLMSDVLSDAVNGVGNFPNKIENVSQIAALYPNYVQIVTSKRTGIETISDLKGKRVATGAQNSGVEVNARNLLEGFGITYNDITVDYLGYAEAADALKSGKIDAAFLTSGLPNSSLMELQQGFDLQIVSIPADGLAEVIKTKPYFNAMEIPAGTYGNTDPIATAAIKNALAVRSDLSEDDVYKLTKTFFESLPQLQTAHQAAKDINLQSAQQGLVAPLHPGAKKYYDEVNAK